MLLSAIRDKRVETARTIREAEKQIPFAERQQGSPRPRDTAAPTAARAAARTKVTPSHVLKDHFRRAILGVLREAGGLMSTRDIADRLVAGKASDDGQRARHGRLRGQGAIGASNWLTVPSQES